MEIKNSPKKNVVCLVEAMVNQETKFYDKKAKFNGGPR